MMKKLVCAGVVALSAAVWAKPALLPEPQSVVWDEGVRCPVEAAVRETTDASIPPEGYRLEVRKDGVTISSSDAAGAFYARQTLSQLEVEEAGKTFYRGCRISDHPAYPWRAVLIDEGRHFLGKETVKRTLDTMALYKLNRLHWHLTEDQGWRIDVPGLPELAQYGSVRAESPKHGSRLRRLGKFRYESDRNGQQYGPFFYTRADLEEIVAYAQSLHIEIVPEIELPGHSLGAIAAFPELTCFPENITNRMAASDWGITTDVLCVGNDKTLRFLERVFDYVCEVFPSKVIHIGGDECPRLNWEKCPKCQARMKAEGLKKAGDLQAWITKKMAAYLAQKGRRIMGWDEILSGDVPMTAIGQSWRTQAANGAGTELVSGAGGAMRGHDMVMTPHSECYYAYGAQNEDDPFQYSNNRLPLSRAYAFDPMTGVPAAARAHVLGSEACVWGEYVWNEYDLAWKLWPRGFAMAEILWRDPQPRDYRDFAVRAAVHRKRLIAMGVNCGPVQAPKADSVSGTFCLTNRFSTGASLVVRGERGQAPAPVLVWFHGGGLSSGTGHFIDLTDRGIIQVAVDYRLMQKDGSVRAEDCIDDAAQAVAWTLENAASFGGDPKKVYVSGHSAGGYLTMMVGMDPRWLAKTGHRIDELAGLIPVSGQATKHFNVRKYAGDTDAQYLPKIDDLAPLAHVTNAVPPILSVCGQPPYEWPCRAEENRLMIASLVILGHKRAWYVEAPGCHHGTVMTAAYPYICDFIRGKFVPATRK